jgi:Amidase
VLEDLEASRELWWHFAASIGIGLDITGSINIPSLCCRVSGLRAVESHGGLTSHSLKGPPGTFPALALGQSIGDLGLMVESTLGARPWYYNASACSGPWLSLEKEGVESKPRTIGVATKPLISHASTCASRPTRGGCDTCRGRSCCQHVPKNSIEAAYTLTLDIFAVDPHNKYPDIHHMESLLLSLVLESASSVTRAHRRASRSWNIR